MYHKTLLFTLCLIALQAKSSELAIGIDLGTTLSCVGLYKSVDGVPTGGLVENEAGARLTPSVVSFSSDQKGGLSTLLIGKGANDRRTIAPAETFFSIKRMIGRRYDDVKEMLVDFPFVTANCTRQMGNDAAAAASIGTMIKNASRANDESISSVLSDHLPTFEGQVCINLNGQLLPVTIISALVLMQLREDASKRAGQTITQAVVTIPAYFEQEQKLETELAASLAGLDLLRLIPEPTAASIAHLRMNPSFSAERLLVFDFGGGTLDISVLDRSQSASEAEISVLAVTGNSTLGGDNFDEIVASYLHEQAARDGYIKPISKPKQLRKHQSRFLKQARKVKESLSFKAMAFAIVTGILDGDDWEKAISRAAVNRLFRPLLDGIPALVTQALDLAGCTESSIDKVLLVGGSSRIPAVKQLLKDRFGAEKIAQDVNPDEAVGVGAAYLAYDMVAAAQQERQREESSSNVAGDGNGNGEGFVQGMFRWATESVGSSWWQPVKLHDVIPRSIGVALWTGDCTQREIAALRPAEGASSGIAERLLREGGADGSLRFTLAWDAFADLDLHVTTPSGEEIYFLNKTLSGGTLDVDMNSKQPYSKTPVENIVWSESSGQAIAEGTYKVAVYLYNSRHGGQFPFRLEVRRNNDIQVFRGTLSTATGGSRWGREVSYVHEVAQPAVGHTGTVCARRMKSLVPRQTRIPFTLRQPMAATTSSDGQTLVEIEVLEGDEELAADNEILGTFKLMGLPPKAAGDAKVAVGVRVDENGIVRVSATDAETGRSVTVDITGSAAGLDGKGLAFLRSQMESLTDENADRDFGGHRSEDEL